MTRSAAALAPMTLLLALASPAVAEMEQFCTIGEQDTVKDDTIACYSDAGCKFAASLGADPVRDYDEASAPYALARGKIAGVVTSSPQLIAKIKGLKGKCRKL